jgi:hypothetical protein
MPHTESTIQALKAQEAKDLAIEFLHKLDAKARGPISPGELQLHELEYEVERQRKELDKTDSEVRRMRQHIEQEPQRIAAAVAVAKTSV